MKKLLSIVLFMIIYIATFYTCGLAIEDKFWQTPTRIKTYIPANHRRTTMMQHAFSRWSKITNNKIIFQYVQAKNNAQIKVYFVDSIPNADREIGLTKYWAYVSGEMSQADIYIADKTADGRVLGNDTVFTVMIHEIGHAIGIINHSQDPLSIMYPTENDVQEITKNDVITLAKIYGWKH